jgi:hypothetical protein
MHPIMFVLFLRRPNQPIPVVINTTRVNSITRNVLYFPTPTTFSETSVWIYRGGGKKVVS